MDDRTRSDIVPFHVVSKPVPGWKLSYLNFNFTPVFFTKRTPKDFFFRKMENVSTFSPHTFPPLPPSFSLPLSLKTPTKLPHPPKKPLFPFSPLPSPNPPKTNNPFLVGLSVQSRPVPSSFSSQMFPRPFFTLYTFPAVRLHYHVPTHPSIREQGSPILRILPYSFSPKKIKNKKIKNKGGSFVTIIPSTFHKTKTKRKKRKEKMLKHFLLILFSLPLLFVCLKLGTYNSQSASATATGTTRLTSAHPPTLPYPTQLPLRKEGKICTVVC